MGFRSLQRVYIELNFCREDFVWRSDSQQRIILNQFWFYPKKGGGVRSIDIATRLGVSKPSVSHAMKLLREDGYIAMDRYGTVTLLEKGAEIANQIYERHIVLARMLEGLGVPAEIAMEDACKMEHDISQESFDKIKAQYSTHREESR